MNLRYTALFVIGILLLLSWSDSPPAGRTGAPGDGACSDAGCHSGTNNSFNGEINLVGLPEKYEPNRTYNLIVRLTRTAGSPVMGGFQMVALSEENTNIGQLTDPGTNSTLIVRSNRTYFQHFPVLRFNNDSIIDYTVQWAAPDTTGGSKTTFYIAANFADGTGSASNDRIILKNFSAFSDVGETTDGDNDGFNSDVDCDDTNPDINPDATEIPNNTIDENCDGNIEVIDADNDGFNSDVDCDDTNADINPDAIDIPNNNIDENCDGIIEVIDIDNDGFNSDVDCDDTNADINPDAAEIPNNNVDENCDGNIEIIDADNDGFNSDEDCDDTNPDINPEAVEIPNNNTDENCDGVIEVIDLDNDGFNSEVDCDDTNPDINPNAVEIPDNNIDDNCDGRIDPDPIDSIHTIAGKISLPDDSAISQVRIIINNRDTVTTNQNGTFSFDVMGSDTLVTLSFYKNTDDGNGVSSLDLINIVNHILGRTLFTDEFVLQAADVNGDSRISSLDLVQITNIILGRWEVFPDQSSWIFAPATITINTNKAEELNNIVIRGIKIGDVTGDADPLR